MKIGILVTGVWLRTLGEGTDAKIEVLVEVAGKWRLIQSYEAAQAMDGMISHITEPLGIEKAPLDTLGD